MNRGDLMLQAVIRTFLFVACVLGATSAEAQHCFVYQEVVTHLDPTGRWACLGTAWIEQPDDVQPVAFLDTRTGKRYPAQSCSPGELKRKLRLKKLPTLVSIDVWPEENQESVDLYTALSVAPVRHSLRGSSVQLVTPREMTSDIDVRADESQVVWRHGENPRSRYTVCLPPSLFRRIEGAENDQSSVVEAWLGTARVVIAFSSGGANCGETSTVYVFSAPIVEAARECGADCCKSRSPRTRK